MNKDLKQFIHEVKDFPVPGVSFKDVTGLLANGEAFHQTILALAALVNQIKPDVIVSPEARGFVFGGAVASWLKIPFVIVRKPGKLPREAIEEKVVLEYGETSLFMHHDAIKPGQKVLVLDDVLATGGTAHAIARLVERLGGKVVSFTFLINLSYLPGMAYLTKHNYKVNYVLNY
jgi:adenine phosphoribosyltransferase